MSYPEKRLAEDLADTVSGVTHIQNNLRVDRGDLSAAASSTTGTTATATTEAAAGTGTTSAEIRRGTAAEGTTA